MKQPYHAPVMLEIPSDAHAKLKLWILIKKGCVELAMLAMFDGGVFGEHLKSAYSRTWTRVVRIGVE